MSKNLKISSTAPEAEGLPVNTPSKGIVDKACLINVGCYNVLINPPNIQLSIEVGKLRVDTKYMRR